MTELTNQCDDCGWILEHYIYTYDDRGYIVAEHTEEADPYDRQPHTPISRIGARASPVWERFIYEP